ncbi:MAG: hypothetical protein GC158_03360 [Cyanobacteria bacterium RI_101]|nr:hypothetical protein [Cyanobacteria bacterium RI_101]
MFYQPPPVYLAQNTAYEECRQQEIENERKVESISPFRESYARRAGQIIADYLNDLCYVNVREKMRKEEERKQKKEIERRSLQLKKVSPIPFQMGEYLGEQYCKILAANPTIETWIHLDQIGNENHSIIAIQKSRASMIYYAPNNLQARQDLESFNMGFYTKQSHYKNCQERTRRLT